MKGFIIWLKDTVVSSRQGIKDVLVSMTPQVAALVTALATSILIARGLGPEGMGNYALIISVSGVIIGLSDLGIGQTAIRFASRAAADGDKDYQYAILRWSFRLRIAITLGVSAIAFLVTPFLASHIWHAESVSSLIRINLAVAVFAALAAIPMIYYQSARRFGMNSLVAVGQSAITLAGISFIYVTKQWNLEWVIGVNVLASGMAAIAFLVLVPPKAIISFNELASLFKEKTSGIFKTPQSLDNEVDATSVDSFAKYMVLSSIIVTLILKADVWLMGVFLPKSDLGLYSVASRVAVPLTILLSAINTVLWPRASAIKNREEIVGLLRKTFKISLLVSAGSLLYAIFAPLLTPWVFGEAYREAIILAQALCVRYCIAILVCPIGVVGYSFGMVRIYWWVNLIQLFVVITANLLLLPVIGALGAALALIINEAVGFLIIGFIFKRRIGAVEAV